MDMCVSQLVLSCPCVPPCCCRRRHHHHRHLLTVVLTITSPVLGRPIRRKERFSSKIIRAVRRVTFGYSSEIPYEASYDDLHIKTVKISETHHFLDSLRGCLLFSFVIFRCLARLTFNKYLLNVSKYLLLIRRESVEPNVRPGGFSFASFQPCRFLICKTSQVDDHLEVAS